MCSEGRSTAAVQVQVVVSHYCLHQESGRRVTVIREWQSGSGSSSVRGRGEECLEMGGFPWEGREGACHPGYETDPTELGCAKVVPRFMHSHSISQSHWAVGPILEGVSGAKQRLGEFREG